MHNEDAMAVEKLSEGIRKFYADARKLEQYARSQGGPEDGRLIESSRPRLSTQSRSQPTTADIDQRLPRNKE